MNKETIILSAEKPYVEVWQDFKNGKWQQGIDVRDCIQLNFTPYEGDHRFLAGATTRTKTLWDKVLQLIREEQAKGEPFDFDTEHPSSINAHPPGYIDKDLEKIVGLQTDAPLKRSIMPYGGIRMIQTSARRITAEQGKHTGIKVYLCRI